MTYPREQIIAWARQVGMTYLPHISEESMKQVEAHAALIEQAARAEERERCIDLVAMHGGPVDLEAAIRALGDKQV